MQLRIEKPWIPMTPESLAALKGNLGVYQIADAENIVIKIGFAGGRSLFGLRSVLQDEARNIGSRAAKFRYEVNQQYTSRYRELLMLHIADNGSAPELNRDSLPERLGRIG